MKAAFSSAAEAVFLVGTLCYAHLKACSTRYKLAEFHFSPRLRCRAAKLLHFQLRAAVPVMNFVHQAADHHDSPAMLS